MLNDFIFNQMTYGPMEPLESESDNEIFRSSVSGG
jgi:hypothetical protein